MHNITKIKSATVYFCDSLSVDGYQYPNGDYALSITSASKALGYSKEWLGRSINRGGNTFKALRGIGFSGKSDEVATPSLGGDQVAKLISLDDFASLVIYAASKGKKEAIALNKAFVKMSLHDFFREEFGDRPLTIEEKRKNFYKTYADSLTREDWLQMDRIDVRIINEQLRFVCEAL